jgi:hypothetical protein
VESHRSLCTFNIFNSSPKLSSRDTQLLISSKKSIADLIHIRHGTRSQIRHLSCLPSLSTNSILQSPHSILVFLFSRIGRTSEHSSVFSIWIRTKPLSQAKKTTQQTRIEMSKETGIINTLTLKRGMRRLSKVLLYSDLLTAPTLNIAENRFNPIYFKELSFELSY